MFYTLLAEQAVDSVDTCSLPTFGMVLIDHGWLHCANRDTCECVTQVTFGLSLQLYISLATNAIAVISRKPALIMKLYSDLRTRKL